MVTGSLTKMTTPDFTQMTRKELKKYILSHPKDDQAIRELFVHRRNPNVLVFSYSENMSYEEIETILRSKLNLE
jgi:hypothetical protein